LQEDGEKNIECTKQQENMVKQQSKELATSSRPGINISANVFCALICSLHPFADVLIPCL